MFQSCLYEMWKLGFDHGLFFASFVSILKCAYYKVKDFRQTTGLLSPGVPPPNLAYQLTLSQPEGADYAHKSQLHQQIFRPSYGPRPAVADSSKVTIKKIRREPIWLCSLRDHSYITSAKGLGTWVQKMTISAEVQYYFMLGGWIQKGPKMC